MYHYNVHLMNKNISMYGLPEKVEFCSKCVMTNQRPRSVVEFKNITKWSLMSVTSIILLLS